MTEVIRDIAAEFASAFAFARRRWAGHAAQVHPELNGAGLMVLQQVTRCGRLSATEIGQHLDMDKATISRQVAKLRELGLVDVSPSAADKRVQMIALSEAGVAAITELRERMASDYQKRLAGWSDADLATLHTLLHRFNSDN